MRRALALAGLLPLTLVLSGCLGDLMSIVCDTSSDSDHCFQTAAVQESDPDNCDKVMGKDFGGVSNPPKDKCFLQIAGNTGDPTICDKIEGGMMSYSKSECLDNVFQKHSAEDCATLENEAECRIAYAKNGRGCGVGFIYEKGACTVKPPTPEGKGADDDIESKVETDLNSIKEAATGKYMDLLTKAIEDEEDDAKKAGLEAYKKFLEESGEKLESVQTTVDQLKEIKRIFLDSYDPSMDVQKMPVNKLLDPGLFDRIKERVFGADAPTPRSHAEDALSVYEAMLKRQGENDFLQQGRLTRLKDVVTSKIKDDLSGQVKDKVKDIAEGVAGTAFGAVGIVDHALTSFQEEAKKEMFVGLAAAYNRQRDSMVQAHPDWSKEQIHEATVKNVKDNPYEDVTNSGFVKFGNILENGDCKDAGDNPLCIDNRVFWTAMDKTYVYSHK